MTPTAHPALDPTPVGLSLNWIIGCPLVPLADNAHFGCVLTEPGIGHRLLPADRHTTAIDEATSPFGPSATERTSPCLQPRNPNHPAAKRPSPFRTSPGS
jgi:hypothetical protein